MRLLFWKRDERVAEAEGKKALDDAQAQWREVREVTESLREIRRKNNFANAIEQIMRGHA
jgi:hypothetical protein